MSQSGNFSDRPVFLTQETSHPSCGHVDSLARPSRAFASQIPFAVSQAAQVSQSDAEKACLMSEELADNLARHAGAVFAHQPFWARKAAPRAGSRKVKLQHMPGHANNLSVGVSASLS